MFENTIEIMDIIWYDIKEQMFGLKRTEAVHMNANDCKKIIVEMLEYLEESDIIFLRQIYTLISRHLERKRRR